MQIDKVSSERLNSLRFLLIIGVVFIHAYGTEVGLSNGAVGVANTGYLVDFFRNIISQGIARVAVPLFFLMSGYFFFLGFSFSAANYKAKIQSRLKRLLIPFLFWNILTLCLIALAQYLPATQTFFSGKNDPISTFGIYDYFNAIFGIDKSPISYQFWFIRDLMVMVLIAPAIYLLLNKAPKIVLLTLISLWFLKIWPVYIPSATAFLFFYAGAYFAHSNTNLFALDRFGPFILFLYLVTLLIDASTKDYGFNQYIHNTGILLGLGASLYATNSVVKTNYLKRFLLWASGCSFFVFAVHEPLLTVMQKVSYKALQPSNDLSILSLYFIIPIFVIILSMLAYIVIKSIAPTFFSVISGGR
jgi:surface polysaccharide O-acyltransferase-like enzyme